MNKRNWRKAFYQHYTAPLENIFPQFKLGAMLFFIGLVVVYGGYQLLQPSLQQEIVTLAGLLVIGSGFIIALMAQVRMLVGRLIRFFGGD